MRDDLREHDLEEVASGHPSAATPRRSPLYSGPQRTDGDDGHAVVTHAAETPFHDHAQNARVTARRTRGSLDGTCHCAPQRKAISLYREVQRTCTVVCNVLRQRSAIPHAVHGWTSERSRSGVGRGDPVGRARFRWVVRADRGVLELAKAVAESGTGDELRPYSSPSLLSHFTGSRGLLDW